MNNYLAVLKKYADFSGRATRSEYWTFFLINFLISLVLSILEGMIKTKGLFSTLSVIYSLAIITPGIAVGIRRMHDIGKSGWMLLVVFIPFIGPLWSIFLLAKAGDPAENEYGPVPSNVGGTTSPDTGQVNYVPTYEQQPMPTPDLTQTTTVTAQEPIVPQAPVPMQSITGLDEPNQTK